jgi:hypothetical protein
MKFKHLILLLAFVPFISCKKTEISTEPTVDSTEEVEQSIPDEATINAAWQEYETPGEAHKLMANDKGIWDEEIILWEHAGANPAKFYLIAESKMIMNGKFQEMTHKGDFDGEPFEGRSILGYDNAEKKYISMWIDNMSTGMRVLKGDFDSASNSITLKGEAVDPVTKKVKVIKEIYTFINDDTHKLETFDTGYDGKEFKNNEITFKRKK